MTTTFRPANRSSTQNILLSTGAELGDLTRLAPTQELRHLLAHSLGYPQEVRMYQRSREILPHLQMEQNDRVLHIDSGIGYCTLELGHKYRVRVDALDDDPEKVAFAQKTGRSLGLHGIAFHARSLAQMRFMAESFDKVLFGDASQCPQLVDGLLTEMNRVLVIGGVVVVVLGLTESESQNVGSISLEAFLAPRFVAAGFEIIDISSSLQRLARLEQSNIAESACSSELIVEARKARRNSYHAASTRGEGLVAHAVRG